MLSSVACRALQDFSKSYKKKGTIFEEKEKVTEHKLCVVIFSKTSV
jgi:hypothetical protein